MEDGEWDEELSDPRAVGTMQSELFSFFLAPPRSAAQRRSRWLPDGSEGEESGDDEFRAVEGDIQAAPGAAARAAERAAADADGEDSDVSLPPWSEAEREQSISGLSISDDTSGGGAGSEGGEADGEMTSAPREGGDGRSLRPDPARLRRKRAAANAAQIREWLNDCMVATAGTGDGAARRLAFSTMAALSNAAPQFAAAGTSTAGGGGGGGGFYSAVLQQGYAEAWAIVREQVEAIEAHWRASCLPVLRLSARDLWFLFRRDRIGVQQLQRDAEHTSDALLNACNELAKTHAGDVAAFRRKAKTYCAAIEVRSVFFSSLLII